MVKRMQGVVRGSTSRAPAAGLLGALSLFVVVLLLCHAFVVPVTSRPIRGEGRQLLSESDEFADHERRTLESSEVSRDNAVDPREYASR